MELDCRPYPVRKVSSSALPEKSLGAGQPGPFLRAAGRRDVMQRLTRDDARRIAINIAKLFEPARTRSS